MVRTCRRSAESIAVIWRSENRGRRDETENRGVSLHPQTLLFQAFFIILKEKGTMHGTDTRLEHSLRAAQSALSANRRKRKIKDNRGEEREGRGERYRHRGR